MEVGGDLSFSLSLDGLETWDVAASHFHSPEVASHLSDTPTGRPTTGRQKVTISKSNNPNTNPNPKFYRQSCVAQLSCRLEDRTPTGVSIAAAYRVA